MCGRYEAPKPDDAAPELYMLFLELLRRQHAGAQLKQGELFPGDPAPVIAPDRQRRKSMFLMKWGFLQPKPQNPAQGQQLRMDSLIPDFPPEEAKGQLVFNARSESAASKPLFAESMSTRHCVVPARWYYEWDHRHGMEKYRFSLPDQELMYLAGLYRIRDGKAEFTILTREAADGVEAFHDRMPVIAPPELIPSWLDPTSPPELLLNAAITRLCWQAA